MAHSGRVDTVSDYDCPPWYGALEDTTPADTILDLVARASVAVERYRAAMDARADYRTTLSVAGQLARATEALVTAIADAVACGENTLS